MLKYLFSAVAVVGLISFPLHAADLGNGHDHGAPAAAAPAQSHAASSHDSAGHPQAAAHEHVASADFNQTEALKTSQAAIGRTLGRYEFRDRSGRTVHLSDLRGKPLVISMIYTSCSHVCPVTTRHLNKVIKNAQAAFRPDSFNVVTIGFDTARDNPQTMADFARAQGIELPHWEFLSADTATIESLSKELGFIYFASPKGFDHLSQTTLVDADGKIYRQVYGETFETPVLLEPLKELISGVQSQHPGIAGISNRIRLFCTVYDPATDSYRADYSLFVEIGVGFLMMAGIGGYLFREIRRRKKT